MPEPYRGIASRAAAMLLSAVLVIACAIGLLRFEAKARARQLENVKAAVQQAVIQCYALEGSYPPSLEYLERNYGLILDRKHYVYEYTVFASNVAPDIFIFRRQ